MRGNSHVRFGGRGMETYQKQFRQRAMPRPTMASTDEGGAGARIDEVPLRENNCQGGTVKPQYPEEGAKFLVVIVRPDKIAQQPYQGVDIAKEPTCGI
ncbi:hypothetical protein SAMN05216174_1163 [Actinokineospora iranica]|uniref:Uncharacterized protein n=3 Tax=Actinokineospora iranica TaxID=1271860 RepID=A0A1G6WXS0_9PSEU|nr:hypothetical protein SAMN05216174_1163 [Actinokineospora iranica]